MKRPSLIFLSIILFVLVPLNSNAQDWDFVGEWTITLVTRPRPATEFPYPVRLSIRKEEGVLTAYYTDAEGNTAKCSDFVVSQNEILFRTGPGGKKNIEFFGPVHRAILKNGKLKGFTFTDRKEFEWAGKRLP
jgi:hypothetical protein